MSDLTHLARPYAKAVFEMAVAQQEFEKWTDMLQFSAIVISDPEITPLINHPKFTAKKLAEFILGLKDNYFNTSGKNFIYLLAENQRLELLPAIFVLFERYRQDHQKTQTVDVTTATPLTAEQLEQLSIFLKKKLQKSVDIQLHMDKSIIGGIFIKAGDLVIDDSIRGQVNRLQHQLIGELC